MRRFYLKLFVLLLSFLLLSNSVFAEESYIATTKLIKDLPADEMLKSRLVWDHSWIEEVNYNSKEELIQLIVETKADTINRYLISVKLDGTVAGIKEISGEERLPTLPLADLNPVAEERINKLIEHDFKSHSGTLGGTVWYELETYLYSPGKTKIAFIIVGDDGHKAFNPTLFVSDSSGLRITEIDADPSKDSWSVKSDNWVSLDEADSDNDKIMLCGWLSDNEILYGKDNTLWVTTIQESR